MLNVVGILSIVSISLSTLITYLSINKIWIRKHDQEVADSVSMSATLLAMFQTTAGFILALDSTSIEGIVIGTISLVTGLLYILISIGFWVNNGLTFRQKLLRAFKMDRTESSAMIKNFIQNTSIDKVFKIVCTLALSDRTIQKGEEKLLREFAKNYSLDYEKIIQEITNEIQKEDTVEIIDNLKKDIESYINTSPPKHVAIWLHDLVEKIIKADGVVSEEESIISEEITGIIASYLSDGKEKPLKYYLVLLPQAVEDEHEVLRINSKLVKSEQPIFGSKTAYILESFYSKKFAQIIREDYVKLYKCAVTIEKF
ncbi:MAG: hypothetical protein KBD64_05250 [Gammaproteobacteria bacterium]|nr:hypothetical protein [Gammaproteobacteria bacterium]